MNLEDDENPFQDSKTETKRKPENQITLKTV